MHVRRSINTAVRRPPGQVQPISTQPIGDCGRRGGSGPDGIPITRASCIACVEKHIGAAYVLLTETRDGYAHHLRTIGHLHEAEDESQQWPDLHTAIREAYQTDGTIPNWEAPAQAAKAVRQAAL